MSYESRITVLGAEERVNLYPVPGGKPREVKSYTCKVMLHTPDGQIDVGTLTVPSSLAPEGVQPGDYLVSYRAGRGFKEDKIVGVMHSFEAVRPANLKAPAAAPAQAQAPKQ